MLEKVAEFLVLTWECVEVFYVVTWVHNRVRTKRDLPLGYARHSFSEMRFPILRDLFLEVEFQAWFRSIVLGSWWVMILVNNTSQYSSRFRPFTSAMYPRSHSLRAFFWSHCCSVLQFVSPKSRGKFWLSASLFIYIYAVRVLKTNEIHHIRTDLSTKARNSMPTFAEALDHLSSAYAHFAGICFHRTQRKEPTDWFQVIHEEGGISSP